jgi:hypothetical protein
MRIDWPSPRALLVLGVVVLGAMVLVAVFVYGGRGRQHAAPVTTTAPPTPAPAPAPFAVVGAAATGASGFSTTVTWNTPQASTARLRWGPAGTMPVLWLDSGTAATSHSVTLSGLVPTTAYDVEIDATAEDGETAHASLSFATPAEGGQAAASTRDGVLLVDGAPFFPLIAWEQCPDQWAPNLAQGIDLFAGNPCTGLPSLLTALQGRALAVGTSDDAPATGPGLIGWFYPDEADGRGLDAATLPAPPEGGVRFLTLTNHFYSGAAPLPAGRGMYPGLIAAADVVGFDVYPLQEFCSPDLLDEVFDAQQQLVALAPGKPTFQWIEVREMKCPSVQVTQADIRAESWLAIAGGANGLGFFPPDWGAAVGATIHGIATRIRQLGPALVQPALPVAVDPATSPVRASARELDGALYIVAVNPTSTPVAVTLHEPDLGDRSVQVLGGPTVIAAKDGAIDDVLPRLAARIYIAPPP